MNYESGLSASDVALLSGRNNNNDGFGDGAGSWWIIIFLIFAFMGGWGRNGFGNGNDGNGSNGGAMDAYVLNSDFATLQRLMSDGFNTVNSGLNQVNQGLCNGFYSTLENFNTTNMNISTGFANLNNALCNQSFQIERGITGLGSQVASCCCDLRQQIADSSCTTQRAIDNINYNMAMNNNTLQNAMCNNTRDIIQSQECGTRAILDAITANRIEDKNAQIQAQQNEINALRLAASQEKQNNYLVEKLNPNICPVPAYLTCNPNAPLNYSISYGGYGYNNGYGCNNGCGCGNNF